MKLNLSLDISILGYKITPVFKTIKIKRKKQEVLEKIIYEFNCQPGKIIKGIISHTNIKDTIPTLESWGVDFYGHIKNAIVSQIIINTNEILGIQLNHFDFKEFVKENQDMFDKFINELKTVVTKYKNQC